MAYTFVYRFGGEKKRTTRNDLCYLSRCAFQIRASSMPNIICLPVRSYMLYAHTCFLWCIILYGSYFKYLGILEYRPNPNAYVYISDGNHNVICRNVVTQYESERSKANCCSVAVSLRQNIQALFRTKLLYNGHFYAGISSIYCHSVFFS